MVYPLLSDKPLPKLGGSKPPSAIAVHLLTIPRIRNQEALSLHSFGETQARITELKSDGGPCVTLEGKLKVGDISLSLSATPAWATGHGGQIP